MAKLSQPFINSYLVKRSFYHKAEIFIQGLKMDLSRSAYKGMDGVDTPFPLAPAEHF